MELDEERKKLNWIDLVLQKVFLRLPVSGDDGFVCVLCVFGDILRIPLATMEPSFPLNLFASIFNQFISSNSNSDCMKSYREK